jgi:hypothetical protein
MVLVALSGPVLLGFPAFLAQGIQLVPYFGFFIPQGFHFSTGIHDRAVILAAKDTPDVGKGVVEQFPAQVHGCLPGKDNVVLAGGRQHFRTGYTQVIGNHGDDHLMGEFRVGLGIKALENIDEIFLGHLGRNKILKGQNLEKAPL